jgi:adenine deaminase
LGSDGPIPWRAHEQIADMTGCGMTPAEVIVASTRNAAALIGMTDTGTIAAKKTADFLVLDANPLDDITNTRRINAVYLRGAQVDRAGLRARCFRGRPAVPAGAADARERLGAHHRERQLAGTAQEMSLARGTLLGRTKSGRLIPGEPFRPTTGSWKRGDFATGMRCCASS